MGRPRIFVEFVRPPGYPGLIADVGDLAKRMANLSEEELDAIMLDGEIRYLPDPITGEFMKRSFSLFRGSITEVDADCIVNSSNTLGALGTGVSAAIREECGIELQEEIHRAIDEILGKESMPWGEAAATSGGKSGRYRCVVHAAVMNYSKGTRSFLGTTIEIVSKATSNSLRRVVEFLPQDIPFSIALPAMGAGVGHLAIDESCRAIVQGLRSFFKQQPDAPIRELVFVAIDASGIDSFRRALMYGLGLPENMILSREGWKEHE